MRWSLSAVVMNGILALGLAGCAWPADNGDLVLYLPFDEEAPTAQDASGQGNDGTLVGGPTWVRNGVSHGALQFDGVDDYIDCGDAESLQFGTGDFTIEAWVKTSTKFTAMAIVSSGSYGPGYGCCGLEIDGSNVAQAYYMSRDAQGNHQYRTRDGAMTLPPLGPVQPVNGMADPDGHFMLQGNDASALVISNSDPLFVGAHSPKPTSLFQGLIDEVRIYRRALSPAEIGAHYDAHKAARGPAPPLPSSVNLVKRTPGDSNWKLEEFMISVWGGPGQATADNLDAPPEFIKQANIEVVMCGLDKLEVCRQYGLKAILFGASPQRAAELKDDPVVWGYYIKDEPWQAAEYPPLAERLEALRKADPNHPGYINLGGSYRMTHSTFMHVVKPDFLSFDYYPWSWGQEWHFSRLEEYRAAAVQAGVPLLSWISPGTSTPEERAHDKNYLPPDSLARLRQTVYTNLAYGVKGIQWFHGRGVFADNTHLTQWGGDVGIINEELQRVGPELVKLQSVDVYHAAPLPRDTRPLPEDYWVQIRGADWVLGVFKDPEDNDFLLLANRDHTRRQWVSLRFARLGITVEKMNKQTGEWERLRVAEVGDHSRVDLFVAAGDGELLRLR